MTAPIQQNKRFSPMIKRPNVQKKRKLRLSIVLMPLLLQGCSSGLRVVQTPVPQVPERLANARVLAEPNFLKRMDDFLQGKLPEPIVTSSN